VYHSRQYKGPDIDVHDLNATAAGINASAHLLPPFPFDSVGYACTSDSAVLGASTIAHLVSGGAQVSPAAVTNPMTAALRAFSALNARKIAVLTPYTKDITQILVRVFEQHVNVTNIASFNQTSDAIVARIMPSSILAGIHQLAQQSPKPDLIFVSCTQARTVDIIAEAEKAVGIPVVASNSAMAWDMMRLAGLLTPAVQAAIEPLGRLYGAPVEGQGPRHACP